MMQTREQKFATKVYEQVVLRRTSLSDSEKTKYGAMAHQLPVLIRTAGLAHALAFVDSRGDQALECLLDDLAVVMGDQSRSNLARKSREASMSDYMYLTREALSALLWFKRFAQSVLEVSANAEVSS
jgi:CRISPR-associated protein Cmr5